MQTTMKLTIRHHDVRSTDELDTLVEQELLSIAPRVCIEEAVVALGCYHDRSPACRALIRIVTPGPDVEVEGSDHTLTAAFRGAMHHLDRELARRSRNRAWQRRSQRQNPGRRIRASANRSAR